MRSNLGNYDLQRRLNEFIVLDLIRRRHPINRTELVRESRLSRATVDKVLKKLLAEGLVIEKGLDASSGGRKPVMFALNSSSVHLIGIYSNLPRFIGVVVDLSARIIARKSVYLRPRDSEETVTKAIFGLINDLMAQANLEPDDVEGIGVGISGSIDRIRGRVVEIERVIEYHDVPLVKLLEERFGVPIYLDNDTNASAFSELWFGSGGQLDDFAYVSLKDGVGLSLVKNGEIQHGLDGNAGHLGHVTIDFDGPRCTCGNDGCLEAFISEARVVAQATELARERQDNVFLEFLDNIDNSRMTFRELFQLEKQGSCAARQALVHTARFLGIGIANVIQLFHPERVILGEDAAVAGPFFVDEITAVVRKRLAKMGPETISIACGAVKKDAGPIGAAAMVQQDLFRPPKVNLPHLTEVESAGQMQLRTLR